MTFPGFIPAIRRAQRAKPVAFSAVNDPVAQFVRLQFDIFGDACRMKSSEFWRLASGN